MKAIEQLKTGYWKEIARQGARQTHDYDAELGT